MDFVDAHMHLIDPERLPYPWLSPPFDPEGPNGDTSAIAKPYTLQSYGQDISRCKVRGLVHVEAGVGLDDGSVELAHIHQILTEALSSRQAAGSIGLEGAAIVAYASLHTPDLAARLDVLSRFPLLRGVRHIVNFHPSRQRAYPGPDRTLDPVWREGLAMLAARDLSFDLQCFPEQMPGLAALFRHHDSLRVVIDHLGMPLLDEPGGYHVWDAGMTAMAACPNVQVKLSGFGFLRRDWDYGDVAPVISRVIDLFGIERCMVASDFPTDLLFAPAQKTLDCIARFSTTLSFDERAALLGGNAARFYRLGFTF
ncbi:amidohydrolase family protein [Asaia krungthepensis]|uniref:Metal-dependent hydrolase n=1 Tax=Asaia krungthepensis NRIC 0535 TaxID=1307925 RepID=A0ABQ0PX50_9PROT|nr:amidohydrolase family protein [Asaia krungthepensis]GBQ83816.1 putative metal-dependent hydrolase [Asaia krungthepensis NRIC 0535]